MTQWRRFIHHSLLSVVAAATLATSVVACIDDPSTTTTQAANSALSGEEVFRGIVFGEGFVAAQLPEVWDNVQLPKLTPEQQGAQVLVKAQLVADIQEADPTFFDRFGADIQSGDHLRIERMMDESAALVRQVTEKRAPSDSKKQKSTRDDTCLAVALVRYVAVALNAVVYINNAVVWSDPEATGGKLERDQVIEMLATRLAAE